MIQTVAAYDRDHAINLLTHAVGRHNQRTRRLQQLSMYQLTQCRILESPESYVFTPARDRFANIHNGNCCGAYADASLYRHAVN